MKTLRAIAIAFACQAAFAFRQQATSLTPGTYRAVYAKGMQERNPIRFIVFGDLPFVTVLGDTSKIKCVITRNQNEIYIQLADTANTDRNSSLNHFITSSFGRPVLELRELRKDTIPFRTTYSRNLHITINEGILVREVKQ